MSGYGGIYQDRARERFAGLMHLPAWPAVDRGFYLEGEADNDNDNDVMTEACLRWAKAEGIAVGPAKCHCCQKLRPELGDVPDVNECPECLTRFEVERAARRARNEAEQLRWSLLTPEQKAQETADRRASMMGVIKRDVQ